VPIYNLLKIKRKLFVWKVLRAEGRKEVAALPLVLKGGTYEDGLFCDNKITKDF